MKIGEREAQPMIEVIPRQEPVPQPIRRREPKKHPAQPRELPDREPARRSRT